jgi:uncharacterized caspase-like protein
MQHRRSFLNHLVRYGSLGLALPNAAISSTNYSRHALVIGNGDYKKVPLKNPVNDARAVTKGLELAGFSVMARENLNFRDMVTTLRDFTDQSAKAGIRLIYFAGHGLQIRGRNHLLPIDVDDIQPDALPNKTTSLNDILDRLNILKEGASIVVLDACRANQFTNTGLVGADGLKLTLRNKPKQGLVSVNAPYGTLIGFSTAPGALAYDNPLEQTSIYAKHFVQNLQNRGLPIEQFFKRVRTGVVEETNRNQIPWESSSLTGDVCLRPDVGNLCKQGSTN